MLLQCVSVKLKMQFSVPTLQKVCAAVFPRVLNCLSNVVCAILVEM